MNEHKIIDRPIIESMKSLNPSILDTFFIVLLLEAFLMGSGQLLKAGTFFTLRMFFFIAAMVLGYFTIFDLGLGRATTKYVAEALGKGEGTQVPQIIWTAVKVQAIMGFVGAIVLLGITDLLVDKVLNIPPELLGEARVTFHLLALSIPVVLIASSFSSVLETAQRFDLINAVKIPSSILSYLLPLVGLALGLGLPGIVALIVLARLGALVAFVAMNLRIRPELRKYKFGIAGTAVVWTVRVALDMLLMFAAASKVCRFLPRLLAENGTKLAVFELVMLAGIAYGLKAFASALLLPVQFLLVVGILATFAFFAWNYVLDDSDRNVVLKVVKLKKILERTS